VLSLGGKPVYVPVRAVQKENGYKAPLLIAYDLDSPLRDKQLGKGDSWGEGPENGFLSGLRWVGPRLGLLTAVKSAGAEI